MDFKFSWRFLDIINPLYWLAFVVFLGKQARKRTYNGIFPGIITVPLGLAFTIAALITTKTLVGDHYGIGWYGWLPAALISADLVGYFLWPFAYSIADMLGDGLGHLTKGLAERVLVPIANALRALPGSTALWGTVEDGKGARKWFTNLLMGGSVVLGTLASGYAGYLFTLTMKSLLATSIFGAGVIGSIFGNGWIIAGFAGFVVARLIWQPLYDTIEKGKVQGLTVLVSGLAGYYAAILLGSTLLTQAAIGAGVFVASAAWVFPALLIFFNDGLQKFGEWVKPLIEKVYGADKNDFRLLFHHSVSGLVTIGLTAGAYILGTKLGWVDLLTYGFAGVTFISSYLGVVQLFKHNGGNGIIGFLTSVAAGLGIYGVYGAHLGYLGWLGGLIAGVIAGGLWGLLILPLLYRGLELTIGKWFTTAGAGLDGLHEAVYKKMKSAYKTVFEAAQNATFRDKTEFKPLFGQVSNVAFAAGVFAAGYLYGLPHVGSPLSYWLALTATALVTLASYLVGGKLAKNDGGEPLIVLLCVGAALWVGGNAFTVLPWAWYWALPAAVVLALVAGYALGLFIIPPVYAVLKTVVNAIPDKASDGWKAGIAKALAWVHNCIYSVVDFMLLKPLSRAVDAVAAFFAPIIVRVSRAYRAVMERIDNMFNRKRPS